MAFKIVYKELPDFQNKLATCRFLDANEKMIKFEIEAETEIIFFQNFVGKKKMIRWLKEDYNFRYNNGTVSPGEVGQDGTGTGYVYHAGIMTKLCEMKEIHKSRGELSNCQCTVLLNKCSGRNKLVAISWLHVDKKSTANPPKPCKTYTFKEILDFANSMRNEHEAGVVIGGKFHKSAGEAKKEVRQIDQSFRILNENMHDTDYFIYLPPLPQEESDEFCEEFAKKAVISGDEKNTKHSTGQGETSGNLNGFESGNSAGFVTGDIGAIKKEKNTTQ